MTRRQSDTQPPKKRHCLDRNSADRPCGAAPLIDSSPPRCWFHSRDNAEALSRGGQVSRKVRAGRSLQAVIAKLYGTAQAPEHEFKLVDEADVVRPSGMIFIESVDGRYKAVGTFDCDDDSHAEFVERSPLDGYVHWLSDHPYALRQRALSLVGIREHTCHDGNRRWRYTTRDEKPADEAKVEAWLALVVPEKPTR